MKYFREKVRRRQQQQQQEHVQKGQQQVLSMQLKRVENVFESEFNEWEIAMSLFSVNSRIVQHQF